MTAIDAIKITQNAIHQKAEAVLPLVLERIKSEAEAGEWETDISCDDLKIYRGDIGQELCELLKAMKFGAMYTTGIGLNIEWPAGIAYDD